MVLGDFKFLGVPCHSIELDDLKVFMADDVEHKLKNGSSNQQHLRDYSSNPVPVDETILLHT